MPTILELRETYNVAAAAVQSTADAVEGADSAEAAEELQGSLGDLVERAKAAHDAVEKREAVERAREQFKPLTIDKPNAGERRFYGSQKVDEPDMYLEHRSSAFMADLYWATLKPTMNPAATERINKHQAFEVQKRAITTATLGGVLPPQYLIGLYAKAGRNGRVFADQMNHQPLPDDGMNLIVPRLTAGLSAAVQATENTTASTADPTEVDLTVPVRTIAGYSPVSRQTLERNAYRDGILFEDLIARYFAALDVQCLNGSGAAGQMLGLLGTVGIAGSVVSTATVAAIYPKLSDIVQQINTNFGSLGYVADKVFMHPRRWGAFTAAVDTAGRPLVIPQMLNTFLGQGEGVLNPIAGGDAQGYGYIGNILGLPAFIDANIPTNLGAGTNEDRIIVTCSPVAHLWERESDPMTLSFEQTTGTSLQVNLVVYGYAAFTAGRYPGACGVISGVGLVPPTF